MINYLLALPALLLFMLLFRPDSVGPPVGAGCINVCLNAHVLWLPLLIVTELIFLLGLLPVRPERLLPRHKRAGRCGA